MITVVDCNGYEHHFADGEFHTEDAGNNLVVECSDRYAVFAEGQWIKAEKLQCLK
jgi:hypothetical protein